MTLSFGAHGSRGAVAEESQFPHQCTRDGSCSAGLCSSNSHLGSRSCSVKGDFCAHEQLEKYPVVPSSRSSATWMGYILGSVLLVMSSIGTVLVGCEEGPHIQNFFSFWPSFGREGKRNYLVLFAISVTHVWDPRNSLFHFRLLHDTK